MACCTNKWKKASFTKGCRRLSHFANVINTLVYASGDGSVATKCQSVCLGDEIPGGLPLFILPSSALFKFLHYHDLLLQDKIYTDRMVGRDVSILCNAILSEDPTYVLS